MESANFHGVNNSHDGRFQVTNVMSWNTKLERDARNWLMVSTSHVRHIIAHNIHEIKVVHNADIISSTIWSVSYVPGIMMNTLHLSRSAQHLQEVCTIIPILQR